MTRMQCSCGAVVHTSGLIPHPDAYYVLAESKYDERADAVDFDLIAESVGAQTCRACGRLYVWWEGWSGDPTVYMPEPRPDGA